MIFLPGDVILTGGRSSINVIFKLSKRISIGNGFEMISSSDKSLNPITVLIDNASDNSAHRTSNLWLNQLQRFSFLKSNLIRIPECMASLKGEHEHTSKFPFYL